MRLSMSLLGLVLVSGCASEPSELANPALGITDFKVSASAETLRIVGVDARGVRVGEVVVDRLPMGRRVSVDVRGESLVHEPYVEDGIPEDFSLPLRLPVSAADPKWEAISSFVLDRRVATPLATWGVAFELNDSIVGTGGTGDEAAYDACAFGGCSYTTCQQGATTDPNITWETRCCNSSYYWRYCINSCQPGGSAVSCTTTANCPGGCNDTCLNGTCRNNSTGCGTVGAGGCVVCYASGPWDVCDANSQWTCNDPGGYCNAESECCYADDTTCDNGTCVWL